MPASRASFFTTHKRTILALLFGLAFSATLAYAVPPGSQYNPGDTLDPSCVPGSSNCSVDISGGSAVWGGITGTLSDQTDLQTALDAKFDDPVGTTSQYIRGNGSLATIPITIQNASSIFSTGLTGTGNGSVATHAVMLGVSAGEDATSANNSNFFGQNAGIAAASAYHSNFLGYRAGDTAAYATNANFIGQEAGVGAGDNPVYDGDNTGDYFYSNFLGYRAGYQAVDAYSSNFIGEQAGISADGAFLSNFMGRNAGASATDASQSNFIGFSAGNGATNARLSNFFGSSAGSGASNALQSNFIGSGAGNNSTDASQSNFIGVLAGAQAPDATQSNFIGFNAGLRALNASYSTFIGYRAGGGLEPSFPIENGAVNAANSIFIGTDAGFEDAVNNTASYDDVLTFANTSILIGHKTSTGGFSNSIAMGAYATNTAANQMMLGSTTRRIDTLVFNGGTGNTCSINAGTGITCSSDERLKTNISDLEDTTLDKVLALRTVRYNWNSDPNGKSMIGFIAQNLNPQFPELTTENIDGMLSVNYAQMTPILVEAIREMNAKIVDIGDLDQDNSWRVALTNWFASATNGIGEFFAKKIHTDIICVKKTDGTEVCLDGDQLQSLTNGQMIVSPSPGELAPSVPDPDPVEQDPTQEELPTDPVPPQPVDDPVSDTPSPLVSEEPTATP